MFKLRTLKEAINLTRMKDEQLIRQRKFARPSLPARALPPPTRTALSSSVKRLTWDEMQRRRAQGLCFNCNDRFMAGHTCRGPQLLLLESHTDNHGIICEDVTEENPTKDKKEELPEPEISLHTLTGWSTPRTMRIKAHIGNQDLMVLIDNGSTHNFINAKMADKL